MSKRIILVRAWVALVAGLVGVGMLAVVPSASAHEGHGHVLLYTEAPAGPWHDPAIAEAAPKVKAALEAEGMTVTLDNDSSEFTDEGLATYDAIVAFQINGNPWTDAEKASLERWMAAGGGIAAVHNALDMRGNYAWWDNMVGSLMPGHAPTGTDPGQPGVVRVEDHAHPSTDHLTEGRWSRGDEWYNFSNNVRGTAHILATMDETTYGGGNMGYDHPISWCKPYEGGRFWGTAMGHFPSHFDEPKLLEHLIGGVKYAAGLEAGDCGGTVWSNFERVPLDQNTSAPYAIDIADDGRVFYTELVRGQIRMYDPATQSVTTVLEVPVYAGGEDGLLGIALDPGFTQNGHIFVYRSPASANDSDPANFFSVVSRFTMAGGVVDPASEKEIIEIPARRLPDEPGHTGGGLDFDAQGNLYIGIGDDVNPHSEPSGGYAPLSERDGTFHDARATSANTNDLRGKLLRITPAADGNGYTIPQGNLFDEAADTNDKTLPEIYAMGFRNPFRFSVDQETGWISMADYSPDNNTDAPATRGPAGVAEWNLIKSPGNYGWPLCMGANEPFRDVDYRTNPVTVGAFFDCANPVNDSVRNTGLTNLPPARGADMYYGYQRSSVPSVIPQGGGLAPMGGPFYSYDEALESDTKFPASYDGKPFFYDWARNKMFSIQVKDPATGNPGTEVEKVNPFLPQQQFLAPIDSKFGPDGSLYVLDWGGGFGRDNPTSGLYRVDYISGSRSPVARITTDRDSGPAPLTVAFDGRGSTDPEGATLSYAWDFDGDGNTDATGETATHTFTEAGLFDPRLTVTDPAGKSGTTTAPITVGNTRPEVTFNLPPNGSFFDFGDDLSWDVEVTDAEDGTVSGDDVIIQPALGHDEHAHPLTPTTGLTGTTPTSLGGHAPDENIFFAIDARYTDGGGAGGANPLTGSDTTLVFPKLREAEFFDAKSASATVAPGRDPAGGGDVVVGKGGAWISFDPVSFHRINKLALRVQATAAGGTIELRKGSATGAVVKSVPIPATGSTSYQDVVVDMTDVPAETMDLFFVFTGANDIKLNFFEAIGRGSSPAALPEVQITAPAQGVQLTPDTDVEVTADASQDGGAISKVEFFVGDSSLGEDATAPYAVTWHTPTEEGLYNLTAVATNEAGKTKTSRIVVAQVGELFGSLQPFTNVNGAFERLASGFRIIGAGNDTWQGTDQYSALYQPAGGDDRYDAVVRVDAHTMTHGSAKAGLIVRNDMTQPGVSPGYAMVALRPAGGMEFLTDADGNGTLNTSVGGGTSGTPKWLKLSRRGDSYSGYWSNTGTSWTQIGTAVTLANAGATQDVGMVEMSHEAAAKSADFSQFAIDTEPTDPQPQLPSDPLTCATGPVSDEFDSPSLLPKWTLRNDPAKPITQTTGSLNLPVTTGDINEANAGPVSFAGQPLPAGSWEATTRITLAHSSHWQWAGLVVHKSDDEYNKLAFVRNNAGGRFIEFQSETGGSRSTPGAPALPADFPTTIHLRLTNTNGTLTAAYSADGTAWTDVSGSTALKTGAGTQIGLMAAGDLGATPVVARADWLRVTPDGTAVFEADDEFDGTSLDGCRWAESVRYNSHTESVADGHLKISTEPGDINANNPISPRNFILQKAPEGDWVATTRLKAPLKHRWQLAGLMMYGDDNNYVKADVVAYNAPGAALDLRAELAAEKNAAGVSGGDQLNIADSSESGYWYVRVTKAGTGYTAEVSDGGVAWQAIGDGITYDGPLRALGVMAIGPDQEEPVTVEFDYFHLDGDEAPADTTAPVTTATWTPAAPDGQNGWFVTAPGFTLGATDEGSTVAGTEYRIDAGTWTAYTGPVSLTGDGRHQVEYRSTDTAGNTETAHVVDVSVDSVAPASTATVSGATVTVTATDATSGVARTEVKVDDGAWQAYTGPVTVTGEGRHAVGHRSVDVAGNVEAESSVEVVVEGPPRDTTAPTVSVTGVTDGATYGDSRRPSVAWTATDAGSGVATVTAGLDGAAIESGVLELWRLPLGDHTLTVSATDRAGNSATTSVTFTTETSIADLRRLVKRFADDGKIRPAVEKRLLQHLALAAQWLDEGRDGRAIRELRAFKNDAEDVRDNAVRSALKRDASWLIESLG
jgi:PKD repeat protein/type 1 glutamine amidotransferase